MGLVLGLVLSAVGQKADGSAAWHDALDDQVLRALDQGRFDDAVALSAGIQRMVEQADELIFLV